MSTSGTQPVMSLRGVSKSYGALRALVDVDLDIRAGEVLAIVGDNGAGKSTVVEIVAGALMADTGTIEVDGEPVVFSSPAQARALGIATVFQDLALCEPLDVVENLFLGNEAVRGGLLDEVEMEKRAWELLSQLAPRVPSRCRIASRVNVLKTSRCLGKESYREAELLRQTQEYSVGSTR